jgi:hypothetical protein
MKIVAFCAFSFRHRNPELTIAILVHSSDGSPSEDSYMDKNTSQDFVLISTTEQ